MKHGGYWQRVQPFSLRFLIKSVSILPLTFHGTFFFFFLKTNPTAVCELGAVYRLGPVLSFRRTGFSRGGVLYMHPAIELFSLMNH